MDRQKSNTLIFRQAIRKKKIDIVRDIVTKNPKMCQSSNKKGHYFSPLWFAVTHGHEEIIELLIKFGADVNEWFVINEDDPGKKLTFFHWLAASPDRWQSKKNIAEIFIKHGAVLNASNEITATPFRIAVSNCNVKFTEFLLKNGITLEDPEFMMDLLKLKMRDSRKMIILFMRYGFDPNFYNDKGENLLHILARLEDRDGDLLKVAEIFLTAGILINEKDNNGITPLHRTIVKNHVKSATFLVNRGADVQEMSYHYQEFPLAMALSSGRTSFLDILLKNGADINAKNNRGYTALHAACEACEPKKIKFLIRKGADITIIGNDGMTPLAVLLSKYYKPDYERCLKNMIEEFSKRNFENLEICYEDMDSITDIWFARQHFIKCKNELVRMSKTKFYPPFSYYSLLTMSQSVKMLSKLAKDEEFSKKFKKSLSKFPCYKNNLIKIFNDAIKLRR